jgi:hypothetical protein
MGRRIGRWGALVCRRESSFTTPARFPCFCKLTDRLDNRRLRTVYAHGGPEVLVLEEMPVPEIHEYVYPLAEVAQAQRDLESRKTTGKLVVEIS